MKNITATKKSYNFKKFLSKLVKNFSISFFFDWIFFNLCIFLFLFAWIRFVTKSFAASIVLSIVILAGINILKIFLNQRKLPSTSQKKLLENTKIFFINYMSLTTKEQSTLMGDAFGKRVKTNLYLNTGTLTLVALERKSLDVSLALSCSKFALKNGVNSFVILCQSCQKEDMTLLLSIKNVKIEIYVFTEAYEYFCKYSQPPKIEIECVLQNKIKFRELAKEAISPPKAKKYFFSGLLIFFCSLVVKYNIYYIVMSSVMFFLAMLCLAKKREHFKSPLKD